MHGDEIKEIKNSTESRDYTAEEDTISLLDLFAVLVKRRRLIVLTTFFAALFILGFAYLTLKLPPDSRWNYLPNIYKPKVEVLVKASSSSSGAISSILSSSGLNSLAGLLGASAGTNSSAELAQALLKGNTIKDQVAEEFNFKKKYNITKNPKTTARNMIQSAMDADYDAKSNILSISYKNIDPVFATKVVNRIVELLDNRFKDLTLEKVRQKKTFLEERLKTVGVDLKTAQDKLVAYQKKYGIIDLSVQAESHIKMIADLTTQVYNKEIELQNLKSYLKDTNPQIVRLKNEIDATKQLIKELKKGFQEFSGETIPQEKLPGVSAEYLNLKRDLSIQETIYTMLRQQYEASKIEETDTSQTFQIIEKAEVPEVKTSPSRFKICIIFTITAFFLAVFIAFIAEYFERVKRDPIESVKLNEIKNMFKSKKG
ncbi:MAG: hypothetical protein DRP57_01270 [Spirochaetes bacterium]|nr:MAG: hypothetical protein DRP57_01270 [Spirochaetota bacterium]